MRDFDLFDFITTLVVMLALIGIGAVCGIAIAQENWEKDCVKRGVAEYNQTTGVWQWKAEFNGIDAPR